jgi:hypothetical protein
MLSISKTLLLSPCPSSPHSSSVLHVSFPGTVIRLSNGPLTFYLREGILRDCKSLYDRLLTIMELREVRVLVADHVFHVAKMLSGECTAHTMPTRVLRRPVKV